MNKSNEISEEVPLLERLQANGFTREKLTNTLPSILYQATYDLIISTPAILAKAKDSWEYKTIETLAKEQFAFYETSWIEDSCKEEANFYDDAVGEYTDAIHFWAFQISNGLTAYIQTPEGDFIEAPENNEYLLYTQNLVKEGLLARPVMYKTPNWAKMVWINETDWGIFNALLYGSGFSLEVEEWRRIAIRILLPLVRSTYETSEYPDPKELTPRAENAYLRLIAYLALKAQDTDDLPLVTPHKAAGIIEEDAKGMGIVGIGRSESIAQKLKKALKLVESEKK